MPASKMFWRSLLLVGFSAVCTYAADPPASGENKDNAAKTSASSPANEPSKTAAPAASTAAQAEGPTKSEVEKAHRPGKVTKPQKTGITKYPNRAINRTIRAYDRLETRMNAQLNLTEEQKKKVASVFDEYRTEVRKNTAPPSIHRGKEELDSPQVNAEGYLKRKVQMKYGKGDPDGTTEKVQEGGRKNRPQASAFDSHAALVEDLTPPLEFEQRQKFERLSARWLILLPKAGLRDGPMARTMRAVKDPGLDVSDSLREDLMNLVGKSMKEHRGDRDDAAKMATATADLRTNIGKQLTPPQNEHFTRTVKELEEEAALEAQEEAKTASESESSDK